MKFRIKSMLSLLTALALVCSFAVIPASAASVGDVRVEIRGGEEANGTYTADVYAVSDSTVGISDFQIAVGFDADVLECTAITAVAGGYNGMVVPNIAIGECTGSSALNVPFVNGELGLAHYTFKVKDDAENGNVSFSVSAKRVAEAESGGTYSVTNGEALPVRVIGNPPALKRVSLAETSVEINGMEKTVQASAIGGKQDKDITSFVTWSIDAAADSGVSIDGNGLISLAYNAKSGTYKVTAAGDGEAARGTAEADLLVTRAASVAKTLTITSSTNITIPQSGSDPNTLELEAEVFDQFGDKMKNAEIDWEVTTTASQGVEISDNVITVSSDATKNATVTATAVCGDARGTYTGTLRDILLDPKMNTENLVYGSPWAEGITFGSNTAKLGDSEISGVYTVKSTGAPTQTGKQTVLINFTGGEYNVDQEFEVEVKQRTITIKVANLDQVQATGSVIERTKEITLTNDMVISDTKLVAGDNVVVTLTAKGDEPGTYKPTATHNDARYKVLVAGGYLLIVPKSVTYDADLEVSTDIKNTAITSDVTYDDLMKTLNVETKITIKVDGTPRTVSVKWAIRYYSSSESAYGLITDEDEIVKYVRDFASNVRGTESIEFVPVIMFEDTDLIDEALQPDIDDPELPVATMKVTRATSGGGFGGGSGSGGTWYEPNRGNENIVIAPVAVFDDVPTTFWAMADINWVYYHKIMTGTSDKIFSPDRNTNRQQMWMVLGRLSGSNPANMAAARTWAVSNGVSDGTNPTATMSRQQLVTMLYRWAQSKGYVRAAISNLESYADAASVSAYARDAMNWAIANGIITGNGNNLNPQGTATRAHFAVIMHRFCDKFNVA